jgi:hypothetical protein
MSNVFQLDRSQNIHATDDVDVTVIGDSEGLATFDAQTGTTQIQLPDGEIEITIGEPRVNRKSESFDENLAELLGEDELSMIAERLLKGIEQDDETRSQWLQNMSDALALLGLQVKMPRGAASTGGNPQEGTSTVDHPLLLEAVLRFQANARGELLPSDGPVKVRNDGESNSLTDVLAEALEKDLNHYLTKVAKEYVPDTDRMLLLLGFSGISFKKGFHDPIKRRPVIQSIDAKDLIVSNAANDIDGAGRVTHRITMRPSTMKRMQLLGAYRNIHLPTPGLPAIQNPVDTRIDQIQGIAPATFVEPSDQDRELYECYCEIDVPGFEHEFEGKTTGLPLPYKVTLDKDARRVLEIRRNWDEDDMFCLAINRIIAYTFIPGLGFYGIGLVNVLGNATKAVTAAWRLMLDAGMFANFPGFLYLKSLAKQLTNQFRIAPGSGMPIDTIGNDIRASVMPLPYKDPSAVFIQLIENIATTAQRVGGTAEMSIGEGKQDAPVGTTLAMIEQATKLMSAVHKRLHHAQAQEFSMLKDLLMEDPEALWRHNKKSKVLAILTQQAGQGVLTDEEETAEDRHKALFLAALSNAELDPRADPNTSSQTERYLKVVAMRQMAQTNPNIDMDKVDHRAMVTMGVDDPDDFFKPPPPPGSAPPSPESITSQATMMAAQARIKEADTSAAEAQQKALLQTQQMQTDTQTKTAELATKERIANLQVARELVIHNSEQQSADAAQVREEANQQRDQQAEQQSQGIENRHRLAETLADVHQGVADRTQQSQDAAADRQHEASQGVADRMHKLALAHVANQHEQTQGIADRTHELVSGGLERRHDHIQGGLDRQHEAAENDLIRQHEQKMQASAPKPKGVAP